MKAAVILIVLTAYSTTAFLFGADAEWDNLRARFSVNPFSSKAFVYLPRTVPDAITAGWSRDTSVGCGKRGTKFNGNRYVMGNDTSIMLLYDKKGYIAGIQAGIPKDSRSEYPIPQNRKFKVFNEESGLYVITAYFVDPADICTKGRSKDDFERQGTGTSLSFQTGPSAASLMRIPTDEKRLLPTTNFVEGKCFFAMGKHYWYNVTEDMSCNDTFPAFLLYDDGRLVGFGWAFNPNYSNSNRWEHPTRNVFSSFMKVVPKCLGKDGPVSTLHVYLTNNPYFNYC